MKYKSKLIKHFTKKEPPSIWLTVYSDWITNLTLFFILLFYTALISIQKNMGKEEMDDFVNKMLSKVQSQEIEMRLKDSIDKISQMKEVSAIVIGDRETKIILQEELLFDKNKAKIKDKSKIILDKIGESIASLPYEIIVEGHTCDLPIKYKVPANLPEWQLAINRANGLGPYRSNWELSAARSLQVLEYLTKKKYVRSQNISATACGPSCPIVPNNNEENRTKNRRVEIKVLTKNILSENEYNETEKKIQ